MQPALDSAQQVAMLSQRLQETEHLLHLSYSHPPNSGFRYGTFLSGMFVALLLVGLAAFLLWSFIQQKLQRKQQVAVVGGLKDMDDSTLKKVLGQVSSIADCMTYCQRLQCIDAGTLQTACTLRIRVLLSVANIMLPYEYVPNE